MKRIPILFVFVAAMSLFSCSKGDDSTPKLELKETNYNLIVNEEVQLELVNTDGKHGKIDPVGTDEIDPVKTA